MNYLIVLGLVFSYAIPNPALSKPYYPQADAEVLEQLPARGQNWLEIRALRQQVADNPNDLDTALHLVRRYIELGRIESDPRYYGYAEAVLTPWLQATPPSAEVLTLRATLFQNRHDFSTALAYLNKALALQPRLAQAWLTRALIEEVQGNYSAALRSCLPLLKLAPPLTAKVCMSTALSLSGQLDSAYQQLQQALQTTETAAPQDKQWAQLALAEMAERIGDAHAATQHYQQAFATAERNGYLLGAYADFLQDQGRHAEVVKLLKTETRADGLLLRLTLAELKLQLPEAQAHIDQLQARFAAAKLRADNTHQGDEARFLLHVRKQPEPALALAQQNWLVQREPRDARILLEAAIAAGKNKTQAQATLDFLAQATLQDVRLQVLIEQFNDAVLKHESVRGELI
ncbi:MAG: hypothetical protein ABL925_08375 [Methylococcales bacterium]